MSQVATSTDQHRQSNISADIERANSATMFVSVVMPCLYEEQTLAACIEKAHAGCQAAISQSFNRDATQSALHVSATQRDEHPCQFGETDSSMDSHPPGTDWRYEVIIADNGSTDGSVALAESLDATVVPVETKGYGAAVLGGIAAARGKCIVMGDSDDSYDFRDIPRFIAKLKEGYDLVVGNRFAGGIMAGAMPWHHKYIGNPMLSGVGRLLYRTPCRDWHCGLRAFDREKINVLNLKCSGMEFASEMVIRSAQAKLRVFEIPIVLHPDGRKRSSHLRSLRDGCRHIVTLLRLSSRLS